MGKSTATTDLRRGAARPDAPRPFAARRCRPTTHPLHLPASAPPAAAPVTELLLLLLDSLRTKSLPTESPQCRKFRKASSTKVGSRVLRPRLDLRCSARRSACVRPRVRVAQRAPREGLPRSSLSDL